MSGFLLHCFLVHALSEIFSFCNNYGYHTPSPTCSITAHSLRLTPTMQCITLVIHLYICTCTFLHAQPLLRMHRTCCTWGLSQEYIQKIGRERFRTMPLQAHPLARANPGQSLGPEAKCTQLSANTYPSSHPSLALGNRLSCVQYIGQE